LTNLLRETLIRSAPSRVVTVASQASRQAAGFDPLDALIDKTTLPRPWLLGDLRPDEIDEHHVFDGVGEATQGHGCHRNCLCPGFNVTGLGRELWLAAPLERLLTWLKVGNPERGAGIIVRLAESPLAS